MKKKSLIQSALFGCIAFIIITGQLVAFKTSNSIKDVYEQISGLHVYSSFSADNFGYSNQQIILGLWFNLRFA